MTRSALRRGAPLAAALCGILLLAAPSAQAQGKKPAPTKTDKAAPPAEAAKSDAPKGDAAPADEKKDGEKKPEQATGAASSVEPPHDAWDNSNVEETPGKSYFFIGARYRGNIVPKFMLNMFVDEGKTIYSNSIGIELDLRKDGFSLIPALQYTEYGTGDILFKQKNTNDIAGNYSLVNSSMKAIYATADLLWSTKMGKNVEFEYGAGFGLGVVFGDLINNWVQESPTGSLVGDNGRHYAPCQVAGPVNTGCNKADHQNASVDKVGNYIEPSWFSGGSKPVVFPWIGFPQIGLRFKPIKQFVARLQTGFSLTGFWFGLNGEYGLERKPQP